MAQIEIDGLLIETDDVDLIVEYGDLGSLDRYIRNYTGIIAGLPPDDNVRPVLEHSCQCCRTARDIIESLVLDGDIPVSRRRAISNSDLQARVNKLSDVVHSFEGNMTSFRDILKEHVNQVRPKKVRSKYD